MHGSILPTLVGYFRPITLAIQCFRVIELFENKVLFQWMGNYI